LDLGLVQWAVPAAELSERAGALAARIAALPAKALAACKSCIADAEDNGRDGFGNELESTARMFSNPETRSRVSAFLDQRRAG
ncbi:MAG: enoyl-CoA hydratase/isomerase family protein, partial [Aquamicrobium sp.]|nr:enoyl-CoA hydratase/isomerase family protein [Aquamicrobium sp.]